MWVGLQEQTSEHSPQHLQRSRAARLCRRSSHSCSRHPPSGGLLLLACVATWTAQGHTRLRFGGQLGTTLYCHTHGGLRSAWHTHAPADPARFACSSSHGNALLLHRVQ